MKAYRHGDVDIKEVCSLPKNLVPVQSNVLAEGEVTGHHHRLVSKEVLTFKDVNDNLFLQVVKPTELVHEEHNTIIVDAGLYAVSIEREHDPFTEEIRRVMD